MLPDFLEWPRGDHRLTSLKVASRYTRAALVSREVLAKEFGTPEALRDYLREHPGADPSKHSVKDEGEHGGHGEEGDHDEHAEKEEAPKKSFKDRLKGLSDAAKGFFKAAPKEVKRFIQDDAFRRKTLMSAHAKLEKAPEELIKSFVHTAKHEVKEYKEAAAGVKAVLSGKKMDKHQKAAFKTVAFHVGLTAAATALTVTGGPLAAAGMFGKSLVKHVAMKAVSNALGHLHVLEELGHVGHGLHHVMDKLAAKKPNADVALAQLVTAAVAKEIEKLDQDAMVDALGKMEAE